MPVTECSSAFIIMLTGRPFFDESHKHDTAGKCRLAVCRHPINGSAIISYNNERRPGNQMKELLFLKHDSMLTGKMSIANGETVPIAEVLVRLKLHRKTEFLNYECARHSRVLILIKRLDPVRHLRYEYRRFSGGGMITSFPHRERCTHGPSRNKKSCRHGSRHVAHKQRQPNSATGMLIRANKVRMTIGNDVAGKVAALAVKMILVRLSPTDWHFDARSYRILGSVFHATQPPTPANTQPHAHRWN